MAHLLGAESLRLEYPTKVVLDGVSLGVDQGDRIGIVGRNGDGKSSLLRLLAGLQEPDSGRVTVRGGVTIGVLDQRDSLDATHTVSHAVVGDGPDHEWAGDARVRDVLAGLLADVPWDSVVGELSGGQRRRVALAQVLIGDHDVLALDEPTNHLDVEAVAWLAEHLRRRWSSNTGGLLLVTHDRWLLDEVCTMTWEVHDRTVDAFEGGYAAYVLQRVERDRQAAAIEQRRKNLARKELAWLRRGAPARTAKPKFRIEAANALIADVPEIRDPLELQSLAMQRLGKDVVDLLDASVSYGDHEVLRDVEWRIAPGERTGILGVNGAGKSTLLGLVDGSVTPTSGRVKRGKTVKVATLTQRIDELEDFLDDPVRVVVSRLRTSYTFGSGSRAQELSPGQLLERLGFSNAHLSTPVKDLSGGQQRRVQLLLILLAQPNVLILDEPTNDLDTDMLAAMEDLLDTWAGTLLVVSHDRYFLERVTDQQYAVMGGELRHLPGGIDEYLRLRREERADDGVSRAGRGATGTDAPGARAGDGGRSGASGSDPGGDGEVVLSGAERRALQKEVASIERRLDRLAGLIAQVHERLAAHDQSDFEGLATLTAELGDHEAEVESLEEQWLERTEELG